MGQITLISAVILAGGRARRLNGKQKGLQMWAGKPLINHILVRLTPQVSNIWLNINHLQEKYQRLYPMLPLYTDKLPNFQGPLSGMLSGLEQIESEYLLFVPCDSPLLPLNLCQKLYQALKINHAKISYVHNGEQAFPTFALIHRSVKDDMTAYLAQGERRLLTFFQQQRSVAVDFSEQAEAFANFNTEQDFTRGQLLPKISKTPLLAITGYSGTGKTTLLEKLITALTARGWKIGLIKHSHHNVDIDKKGKDSHRLRLAGANPTMLVCDQRWALMTETAEPMSINTMANQFEDKGLDLILVEGFKQELLPKIQLHREAIDKPLPELDAFTLATATDYPLDRPNWVDINNLEQIIFVIEDALKHGKL